MSDKPLIFVAFGVTGDLMKAKILPALFSLYCRGELPEQCAILGISRKEWSNGDLRTYIEKVLSSTQESTKLQAFLNLLFFVQGDAHEKELYERIAESCGVLEKAFGKATQKILHISLSPILYKDVFTQLINSPFAKDSKHIRLMIEKPFGSNSESAKELNTILHTAFDENAIYRVDHYLAKESLLYIPIHAPKNTIKIEITFFERNGVEHRGVFYDSVGALRDVGQNHSLEMFAKIIGGKNRLEPLRHLKILSNEEVATQTKRGQYEGYKNVPGVKVHSQTETYFKIETTYKGIPVIFEGGKKMPEDKKLISFTYTTANGASTNINYNMSENANLREYEILIKNCILKDRKLFVSSEEVLLLWNLIDPIINAWGRGKPGLQAYT